MTNLQQQIQAHVYIDAPAVLRGEAERPFHFHHHFEINPDTKPYEPFGAAKDLLYYHGRRVLIEGAAGTGKTRGVLEKVHYLCQKYPGIRVLGVRATKASMAQSVLVTFEKFVVPKDHPIIRDRRTRSGREAYYYPERTNVVNGVRYSGISEFVIGGMNDPERIMSTDYDLIVYFESTEGTFEGYMRLRTRLRNNCMPYQQLILDCNPADAQHWLNQEAIKGILHRLQSVHADNPSLTQDYLDDLESLTGHLRDRLWLGKWVSAEGMVYPDYAHVFVEHYNPPPDGILLGGIDFGYRNPFCALAGSFYLESAKPVVYIWYERYVTLCDLDEHAREIPRRVLYKCDPSGAGDIDKLKELGHRAEKAENPIRPGVEVVNAWLTGKGGRVLRISRDACPNLFMEFGSYEYKKGGSEMPVDKLNHALDALRYMLMEIDKRARRMRREKIKVIGDLRRSSVMSRY